MDPVFAVACVLVIVLYTFLGFQIRRAYKEVEAKKQLDNKRKRKRGP